jgi:hypothetical protein
MFRYGNGEPGMGKIPDWHPRYQRTKNTKFCPRRRHILEQNLYFTCKKIPSCLPFDNKISSDFSSLLGFITLLQYLSLFLWFSQQS